MTVRSREDLRRLARAARLLVQLERESGIVDLPGTPRPAEIAQAPTAVPSAVTSVADPGAAPNGATSGPQDATPDHAPPPRGRTKPRRPRPAFVPRVAPLDLPADVLAPFGNLPARVDACRACPLGEKRTHAVFGEGSPTARLVFCGEAPGRDEDRSGRPFVGAAGELLSAMIERGMGMRREDVFILNTLKCRPPNNRTPTPDESAACRTHLDEQLRRIAPDVIVALGNPAVHALLGDVGGITRVRGRVFEAFDAQVVPTYHPAYLLRDPSRKAEAWADLKLVMRLLDA